jgi:hypothetical protein
LPWVFFVHRVAAKLRLRHAGLIPSNPRRAALRVAERRVRAIIVQAVPFDLSASG